MPPGGKTSKVGERIRLSIRAQTGVRHKSKAGWGGLQKRAGHMQLLVPRGPQWEGPHWGIKVSGDYAVQMCRVGVLPATSGLLGH